MNDIVYAGAKPGPYLADAWTFAYCAAGSGVFRCGGAVLPCKEGEVAVFPPQAEFVCSGDSGARFLFVQVTAAILPLQEPAVVQDRDEPFLKNAFEAALHYFCLDGPDRVALLTLYGSLIIRYLAAYQTPRRRTQTVEEISLHILAHFADPAFSLNAYLRSLPFNYDYLRKLFQKETGVTPLQFLNNIRLQSAAEALCRERGEGSGMTDVARRCGFREPLYFSRMFKKKYGVAPSYYAQSVREEGKTVTPEKAGV